MPVVLVGAFTDAALLLLYIVGWAVALGLLYSWNATFHHIFQGIAHALTFTVGVGFGPKKTIHLGGWASSIDHAAQELLSDWALGCEILVGKFWHALTWIFDQLAAQVRDNATATLDLGRWIVHTAVPDAINTTLEPFRSKSNKTAAVAGAAGLGVALLRKVTRAEHRAESAASAAAKSAARAATHDAAHAKSVATTTAGAVAHEGKVITEVIDVGALPAQFGRTVTSIRRRLGRVEALLGATAMAAAMANVLGIPSWRCLTKGPIGRTSRALCGLSSAALNDLLGLLVDVLIVEDICQVVGLLESGLQIIEGPINDIVGVVGGSLCHGDYDPPPEYEPFRLSLPPVTGLVLNGV